MNSKFITIFLLFAILFTIGTYVLMLATFITQDVNGSTDTVGDLYVGYNFVLYEEPTNINFGQLVKEAYGDIYTIGNSEYGLIVKNAIFSNVHWELYICDSCPIIVIEVIE